MPRSDDALIACNDHIAQIQQQIAHLTMQLEDLEQERARLLTELQRGQSSLAEALRRDSQFQRWRWLKRRPS